MVKHTITVIVPNSVIGGDEPGQPLGPKVVDIIYAMARAGYMVVDFGEPRLAKDWNEDCTELEFEYDPAHSIVEIFQAANHFVTSGGDV